MGLAERRAVKDFQDKQYPELKRALDAAAGFGVEVEVNWDTLAQDEMSHLYAEAFPKVYFKPIIDAFQTICADQMGKDALKGALKKVVICNTSGYWSPEGAIKFEGGTLKIDHEPCSNIDYIEERTKHIVSLLEKSL